MKKNYIYIWQVESYKDGESARYHGTSSTEAEAKARLREYGGYARDAAARIYKSEVGNYSRNAEEVIIYERGLWAMA